jgi:hypothetical protein
LCLEPPFSLARSHSPGPELVFLLDLQNLLDFENKSRLIKGLFESPSGGIIQEGVGSNEDDLFPGVVSQRHVLAWAGQIGVVHDRGLLFRTGFNV